MNVNRKSNTVDWKKIFLIIFVIVALVHQWYQREDPLPRGSALPAASQNQDSATNDAVPSAALDQNSINSKVRNQRSDGAIAERNSSSFRMTNLPDHGDYLEPIGDRKLKSPAGLIYGGGPEGEHRVDHVMRHAVDVPSRPVHGVFDGDRVSILQVIDEAYKKAMDKSLDMEVDDSDTNTVYTVNLHRRIGYEGGQRGRDRRHRELKRIRLVLSGDRVITAYPYR